MKNGQIFARKSTARGRLDLEYLDETSNRKVLLREREEMSQQIGRKLKRFADYASKESLGQVHVGGFLHHHIRKNPDGTSTAPSQLSNQERKRRISDAWVRHLERFPSQAKRPVMAHRLIFSMSKEQHDALLAAGLNPDRVLHASIKKVMQKFAETFHPGDSIGFAYGIHHDTNHLHAHLALCPRTANGNYVGCTTSRSRQSRHKKQMDMIKTWFTRENERWEKILSSPEEIELAVKNRPDSDKSVVVPRLSPAQLEALRNAQTAEAIRLQQSYQSIRNLEAAIAAKRAAQNLKRNSKFIARLLGDRKPPVVNLAEKLAAKVDRRSLREMQNLLFKIKRQYRAAHQRYSRVYGFTSHANRNASSIAQQHQPTNRI